MKDGKKMIGGWCMVTMIFGMFWMLMCMETMAVADDEAYCLYPIVYQRTDEELEMVKASASIGIKNEDTVYFVSTGITLKNNTDRDMEIVNATLLLTDKDEVDRLMKLPRYSYSMEMLRKRYERKWYRRIEYNGADKTPTVVKAGEEIGILFLNDEIEFYTTELDGLVCLFQVYAVPR